MAVQQKALAVTHKDKPFTLIRHAVPTPGPGDLLVKVEGAALKPGEWKLQTGVFDPLILCPDGYPMFLGTDGAGTVVEVGEGVETFKKGDRAIPRQVVVRVANIMVFSIVFAGWVDAKGNSFQEYTLVDADLTAKIPETVSSLEASAIPLALATVGTCDCCIRTGPAIPRHRGRAVGAGLMPFWEEGAEGYSSKRPILILGGASIVGQYRNYTGCKIYQRLGTRDPVHYREKFELDCNDLGISFSRTNLLLEEQERELAHEKESEREVERIAHAEPLPHHLDHRIHEFLRTGTVSDTFISLEACLENTSRIPPLPQGETFRGKKLSVTKDFRDTIILPPTASVGSMDGYLRGVQWMLSSDRKPGFLLLISPFEANELLPTIRNSLTAHLHLYSPRVSQNARSLESLDVFVVPKARPNVPNRRVVHELNLFAGQLFFTDKVAVEEVCCMLGLYLDILPPQIPPGVADATGFVQERWARTTLGIGACSFVSNPLPFMRAIYGWRRKGQGFGLTHLGKVLNGIKLEDSEFEDGQDST